MINSFILEQHTKLDFIVLAHWNNSWWVDMSLHLDTLFWLWANQLLLLLLNSACFNGEAANTCCIVFGLTDCGLQSTIYHTQGEHTDHFTTNVVQDF
jgi:hypothetical protein